MSKTLKQWHMMSAASDDLPALPGLSPITRCLLWQRGVREAGQTRDFLYPDFFKDGHDPFLFSDMGKAVDRIKQARERAEKVVVHGDYDADGVCSSALLVSSLRRVGLMVDVYLPHREREGYGLNLDTVRSLAEQEVKLIITTDCGVTSVAEVALARELGVDVIVTDHHQPPEKLPEAVAVINPQVASAGYPYPYLSGTGVAYKLAAALAKVFPEIDTSFLKWLLDLVAIATIADCMILQGENRMLVKYGLIVLQKTRRLGLQELMRQEGIDQQRLASFDVSWRIAPVINAVGRLGHSRLAYELLMSDDRQEARALAVRLQQINEERRRLTGTIVGEARQQIGDRPDQKVLLAYSAGWSVGVVGLVAGRLANEYARPAFVVGGKGEAVLVGSGRSIPGVNITGMLRRTEKWLSRFGGHEQACGFTLKEGVDIAEWHRSLQDIFEQEFSKHDLVPRLMIDMEIDLVDVIWSLVEELALFEPFGEGNKKPLFLGRNVRVVEAQTVGADSNHLRLKIVDRTGRFLKCIGFGLGRWIQKISVNTHVDIVFVPEANHWNGSKSLQLRLEDIDLAGQRTVCDNKMSSTQAKL